MLKQHDKFLDKVAFCVDATIVGISFVSAFALRDDFDSRLLHEMPLFAEYLPAMLLVIPLWVIMLKAFGVYDSMREKSFGRLFWSIF